MRIIRWALLVAGWVFICTGTVRANGGPFVVKYPGGDPAAKGVLARLGPDLKPGQETRLRVVKEDLTIDFDEKLGPRVRDADRIPLVDIKAIYTIENPTDEKIELDLGFPILRGIFLRNVMGPMEVVRVRVDEGLIPSTFISNSVIYGIIRQQARETIEKAVSNDKTLAGLVAAVHAAKDEQVAQPRQPLLSYLVKILKWSPRDAGLFVEYTLLDLGSHPVVPGSVDSSRLRRLTPDGKSFMETATTNLGPLAAIGEQKATQFFAHLAGLLRPEERTRYEDLFKAWGGDVRELALDMQSGIIRPRVFSVNEADQAAMMKAGIDDPTVYARVDYLDANAKLSDAQRAACQAILKDLPVVFTFAPMNLLYYRPVFKPHTICKVQVEYQQYAYADTQEPQTFQIAYVVHPASFWKDFGPIHLKVSVPQGVQVRASVPLSIDQDGSPVVYQSTLTDKTGELYVAVNVGQWKTIAGTAPKTTASIAGKESKVQ